MMSRGAYVTAFLAAAASIHGAWASTPYLETDVLVVGGGSAGTYAAIQLADRGKRVLLVEKSGKLGGHANAAQRLGGAQLL
ncbi:hypothetical protein MAPG_05101 [Magnaporthiopsis poae ATCC 64411]|uniref:FAD dependent oxidoreductase domain-containing protein n=1 Tax=Magnaporthiopsis poae (strain ATCC 64411 / 73-15) TaxID=644358 RepID=A0A0C4DYH9_MAGP6|nr:hypothetical protein MAPG_05101 [Magnaporthiopsis poae ATCC 64411]